MVCRIRQIGLVVLMGMLAGACTASGPETEDQEDVSFTKQAMTSEGPFFDQQALINFWTATSTGGAATQIFLNGSKVYERPGFGPAFVKQYFSCMDTIHHAIYAVCPTGQHDGFTNFNTLVSRYPVTATIFRDGVLFRSGTDPGSVSITTCTGDLSFLGCSVYYKVTTEFTPFLGVPYTSSCYSHNSSSSCP